MQRPLFPPTGQQPFLDVPRQRRVHVVAAQHQMIAHRDAPQLRTVGGNARLTVRFHDDVLGSSGQARRKRVAAALRLRSS